MAKPDLQKRRDALYGEIEAADLAYHEAKVKELKARKAHTVAEKAAAKAREKCEELWRQYRLLDEEATNAGAMPEGGA